ANFLVAGRVHERPAPGKRAAAPRMSDPRKGRTASIEPPLRRRGRRCVRPGRHPLRRRRWILGAGAAIMDAMSSVASSLATTFYGSYRGTASDPDASDVPRTGASPLEALDVVLADFAARGQAAWPDVTLPASTLASYLGERAPADTAPLAWLA